MITQLADWTVFIFLTLLLATYIVKALRTPDKSQIEAVKNCLLDWVVQAEAMFGSGTGKVKLSDVYAQFAVAFPELKPHVGMDQFSELVDEALDEMRKMTETNQNLRDVIGLEEGQQP